MGRTTDVLITDMYTLALSHFPTPALRWKLYATMQESWTFVQSFDCLDYINAPALHT